MTGNLLQLFPMERRAFWEKTAEEENLIQEIRLRAGRPVSVFRNGKEWYLTKDGDYTDKQELAYRAHETEAEEILQHICHYSLYAYEDELRQGFITVAGGHRVGITGQAVLEADRTVRTIKHVTCMNIRVSHQIRGAGNKVLPYLYRNGELLSTLIISPPGCGKTTLLRDLVRQVSDGNQYGAGRCVGVVDERSEIAGCYLGRPQNDVGMRTDVLDACPKALGMMMLLRAMSPQVIAIDELGGLEDTEAVHMAACCGSRILATIHGDGIHDIRRKEGMDRLFREGLFQCFVVLGKKDGRCIVRSIYGKEEPHDSSDGKYYGNSGMPGAGDLVSQSASGKAEAYQMYEPDSGNDDKRGPLQQGFPSGMLPQAGRTHGRAISERL